MSYLNKHKLVYLHAQNNTEFITSDNPIINLCAQFDEHGAPTTYELLWPLTPRLALLLTENKQEKTRVVENNEVQKFNHLIHENAERYVIARKKGYTNRYLKLS